MAQYILCASLAYTDTHAHTGERSFDLNQLAEEVKTQPAMPPKRQGASCPRKDFKRDVTRCPREGPTTLHQQRVANTAMRRARDLLEEHEGSANDALFAACESGESDVVVCLVKELGARVQAQDTDERTPLDVATQKGHLEVMRALVKELGANVGVRRLVECPFYLLTPLHIAAGNGELEAIRVLANELGAKVDAKGPHGSTALHSAAANGPHEAIRVLVARR